MKGYSPTRIIEIDEHGRLWETLSDELESSLWDQEMTFLGEVDFESFEDFLEELQPIAITWQ